MCEILNKTEIENKLMVTKGEGLKGWELNVYTFNKQLQMGTVCGLFIQ